MKFLKNALVHGNYGRHPNHQGVGPDLHPNQGVDVEHLQATAHNALLETEAMTVLVRSTVWFVFVLVIW